MARSRLNPAPQSLAQSQRGFSLLEVLVAFSILALSLGVLMQIFSGAMRNAVLSEQYSTATLLAQSLLSATRAEPLQAGEQLGEFANGMRWRRQIEPMQAADERDSKASVSASALLPGAAPGPEGGLSSVRPQLLAAYRVRVEVSWSEGDDQRQVDLTSLRVATP